VIGFLIGAVVLVALVVLVQWRLTKDPALRGGDLPNDLHGLHTEGRPSDASVRSGEVGLGPTIDTSHRLP
jgi:hypothetical protein